MPSFRSGITSGLGLCIRPYRYASQLVRRQYSYISQRISARLAFSHKGTSTPSSRLPAPLTPPPLPKFLAKKSRKNLHNNGFWSPYWENSWRKPRKRSELFRSKIDNVKRLSLPRLSLQIFTLYKRCAVLVRVCNTSEAHLQYPWSTPVPMRVCSTREGNFIYLSFIRSHSRVLQVCLTGTRHPQGQLGCISWVLHILYAGWFSFTHRYIMTSHRYIITYLWLDY